MPTTKTRRAQMFAAKWLADDHAEEPTDEALQAAFQLCAKPAKPELYPAIRDAITHWDATGGEA